MDGWIDGRMDGRWMEGWMDRWIEVEFGNSLHTKVQSQMQQICPPRSIVSKKAMTC